LVQLLREEEVLPVVLLGLQVLLRGGLAHLLALGDLLVLIVGEVLGFDDVTDLALLLSIILVLGRPSSSWGTSWLVKVMP
ncbi:MAG: hypothetical protein ACKPKO_09860, partial [Candidatus Fonsibacter sp.]